MKLNNCFVLLIMIGALSAGCKKAIDTVPSSVFVRLFPTDTSYYTGGAFQLPDGNFIVYGYPPENNELRPLIIKSDLHGNIIWKNYLPSVFHYCTIKAIDNGTMMAVGVVGALSSIINVCELDDSGNVITGTLKEYPVDNVRSGPAIPPKFEITATGDLVIAGTVTSNDYLFPFVLLINSSGIADPPQVFNFNLPGVTQLITKGLSQDQDGFTVSGSTYKIDIFDNSNILTFCLRLNTDCEEVWRTILTSPEGSITSKGVIKSDSSIIVYGSQKKGSYNNSAINDMPGTLYTQEVDDSGNLVRQVPYYNYPNLAHAGELLKTTDGFIMAATTNELLDIHLVSDNHIYLLKLDNKLEEEWYQDFNGFNAFTAVSVFPTLDGGYLIGGYEHSGTFLYNMCLIKTDANGNIVLE